MTTSPLPSHVPFSGIIHGPSGSLLRDRFGIDIADFDAVFSSEGVAALRNIHSLYFDHGATIGTAFTLRLTDCRPSSIHDWDPTTETPVLSTTTRDRNHQAVSLVRDVFGENFVASISSIPDSNGSDDDCWKTLGSHQYEWVKARQRPQMEALKQAGVHTILCEAFRYITEVEAVVDLACELGFDAIYICFEASSKGIPDPDFQGRTFKDLKQALRKRATSTLQVFVGINCTAINNIFALWERGDSVDIAYANSLNFSDRQKIAFDHFIDMPETLQTPEILHCLNELKRNNQTLLEQWVHFLRSAFCEHNLQIAGGCCGTGPEHVWVGRRAWEEALSSIHR